MKSGCLTPTTHAVAILNQAAAELAYSGAPGSGMGLDTLHNAVIYLLTGDITGRRGVAHFWTTIAVVPQAPREHQAAADFAEHLMLNHTARGFEG